MVEQNSFSFVFKILRATMFGFLANACVASMNQAYMHWVTKQTISKLVRLQLYMRLQFHRSCLNISNGSLISCASHAHEMYLVNFYQNTVAMLKF